MLSQATTALSQEERTFALRRARMILRSDHPQPIRDAAISTIWDHDPRATRSSYAFHLRTARDARQPVRTRAASLDWLAAHTASGDQVGQSSSSPDITWPASPSIPFRKSTGSVAR
ncbi:hypothetical protein [Mangrovicoccus ximenensis]|uniref:hypothetical protein n=1 Tax=Mangrovicoccus ximenensis TaxID=1911570 RepID=UPI0011AE98F7|nr:hypothetical protein [Mangrovicoccus ximenensis]